MEMHEVNGYDDAKRKARNCEVKNGEEMLNDGTDVAAAINQESCGNSGRMKASAPQMCP